MTESEIKAKIRMSVSRAGVVLWQQPVGKGKTISGSVLSFGLCNGSSDMIGIRKRDGKFVALEAKTPEGLTRHKNALARAQSKIDSRLALTTEEKRALDQHLFVELVRGCGGIAGFPTSALEAIEIVIQ